MFGPGVDGCVLWDLPDRLESLSGFRHALHMPTASSSSSSSVPSILVDTNIVSGLVKGDLPREQAQAVVKIVEMMQRSDVTLAGTTVMRDELNKIPAPHRSPHIAIADTLRTLKTASGVTWLDANSGAIVESPTYAALRRNLPDEPDARMIAIGEEHHQDYFMTDDRRSVLSRRERIASICSIKPRWPTEILAELTQRST